MKGKLAKTGGREGRMWGLFPSEKEKKIINTPKCTQQITETQNRTNKSFKSKFKGNQTVWIIKGLTGSQDCRLARWVFSAAPNPSRGSGRASKKMGRFAQVHTVREGKSWDTTSPSDFRSRTVSRASQILCSKFKAGKRWSQELKAEPQRAQKDSKKLQDLSQGTTED